MKGEGGGEGPELRSNFIVREIILNESLVGRKPCINALQPCLTRWGTYYLLLTMY